MLRKQMIIDTIKSNIFKTLTNLNIDINQDEIGHSYAPTIQDEIINILNEKLNTCGITIKKTIEKRANSDCIILDDNNYNTNIKFGWTTLGQPNVCAMNRILENYIFLKNWKEKIKRGYWLLKIKVLKEDLSNIKVSMVNIFDIIDCLTYNMGTGQIMLNESKFYNLKTITECDPYIAAKKIKILYINEYNKHIGLKKENFEKKIKKFPV